MLVPSVALGCGRRQRAKRHLSHLIVMLTHNKMEATQKAFATPSSASYGSLLINN